MQTPILIPLAHTTPSLLGKTTVYYDASGTKPARKEKLFEMPEFSFIKGFEYKVDLELLRRKVRSWNDSTSYGNKYLWHGNRALVALLSPVLKRISDLLSDLEKKITPEEAGAISEEISVCLMSVQPSQSDSAAFMKWFKINDLVDEFRCRYSAASMAFNAINFHYDYTTLGQIKETK